MKAPEIQTSSRGLSNASRFMEYSSFAIMDRVPSGGFRNKASCA